ncbi:MAG TPA: hypothetical protein VFE48_21610 [Methylomirabilota bacterium]|nr:hypothetical protein [Methylomirabilota bacterium]
MTRLRETGMLLASVSVLVACGATAAAEPGWPEFLAGPAAWDPGIVYAVRRVWGEPTLHRRVVGPPAPMPVERYLTLVDLPDVTAAAARDRGLPSPQVRWLGADWYEADDHGGARGVYRVLARDPHRRVILSWGRHTSHFLGDVGGSALSVLTFRDRDGETAQDIEAYVRIDDRAAAALARALSVVFGWLADRKLAEGFGVSVKVARWIQEDPAGFCHWLRGADLPEARRRAAEAAAGRCAVPVTARGAGG